MLTRADIINALRKASNTALYAKDVVTNEINTKDINNAWATIRTVCASVTMPCKALDVFNLYADDVEQENNAHETRDLILECADSIGVECFRAWYDKTEVESLWRACKIMRDYPETIRTFSASVDVLTRLYDMVKDGFFEGYTVENVQEFLNYPEAVTVPDNPCDLNRVLNTLDDARGNIIDFFDTVMDRIDYFLF